MVRLPPPSNWLDSRVVHVLSGAATLVDVRTSTLPPGGPFCAPMMRLSPDTDTLVMRGRETVMRSVPSTVRLAVSHIKPAKGGDGGLMASNAPLYELALKSLKTELVSMESIVRFSVPP